MSHPEAMAPDGSPPGVLRSRHSVFKSGQGLAWLLLIFFLLLLLFLLALHKKQYMKGGKRLGKDIWKTSQQFK